MSRDPTEPRADSSKMQHVGLARFMLALALGLYATVALTVLLY